MKYVITGVDEQLGGLVAQNMIDSVSGDELIFIYYDLQKVGEERRTEWNNKGITLRLANYGNKGELVSVFSGGERLFMTSDYNNTESRDRNIIDAAKEAGIKHITYASFLGMEKDVYLEKSGLDYSIMYSNPYMDDYLTDFAKVAFLYNRKWRTLAGEGKATFVVKDDWARVAVALLLGKGRKNESYNVTGGQLLNERYISELVSEVSGVKLEYTPMISEEFSGFLDYIKVPRSSDGDKSKSPLPWCSNDIISNKERIRDGLLAVETNVVRELTGREPMKIKDIVGIYAPLWAQQIEQGYQRENDIKRRRKKYWAWHRNK